MKKYLDKDLVIQPNAIAKSVYKCTSLERKLIFFSCKAVKKHIEKDTHYTACFTVKDFLTALNIDCDSNTKREIRNAVENLAEKHNQIQLWNDKNAYIVTFWYQYTAFENDTITLEFSNSNSFSLGQYIYNTRANYACLSLSVIGGLKSFYSIRFYELAISFMYLCGQDNNNFDSWYFDLWLHKDKDNIKTLFQLSSTYAIADIRKKIITPALKEINENNPDFTISVDVIRQYQKKRLIDGYHFDCKLKGVLQQAKAKERNIAIVDLEQQRM